MDLIQINFLLLGHEKNVIYSKLANNPFKHTTNVVNTGKDFQLKFDCFSYCGFIRPQSVTTSKVTKKGVLIHEKLSQNNR